MKPDSKFDAAVAIVLQHEGGFANDPDDPGGATNWGISLRYLNSLGLLDADGDGFHDFDFDQDGDVDPDDIRAMPRERAIALYREHWWERHRYADMPDRVGGKAFDLAVNMGARQAHRLLQRALIANGARTLKVDGIIGEHTRRTLSTVTAYAGTEDGYPALTALRSEAAGFYRGLIISRPAFRKFEGGWLRRAYA